MPLPSGFELGCPKHVVHMTTKSAAPTSFMSTPACMVALLHGHADLTCWSSTRPATSSSGRHVFGSSWSAGDAGHLKIDGDEIGSTDIVYFRADLTRWNSTRPATSSSGRRVFSSSVSFHSCYFNHPTCFFLTDSSSLTCYLELHSRSAHPISTICVLLISQFLTKIFII